MNKISPFISWITQALFLVAIVSGIPLIFFYHPTAAFESVQKITYLLPSGDFIRKLHYFSSEALLVFVIIHLIQQFFTKDVKISKLSWCCGILAFVFIVFLMFTGFVLKADQQGHSAGLVAISIINNLPIISILSPLVESTIKFFYWKFLIWHILLLPALVLLLLYYHSNRIDAPMSFISIAIAASILCLLLIPMPKDIPPNIVVKGYLKGPWIFYGVEKLLDYGVNDTLIVLTTLFIPFFMLMYYPFTKFKNLIKAFLVLWLIFYVSLSLV